MRIAGIQRTATPSLGTPVVVVCAADHGVAAEGVSAYPSSVTAQMVANYAAGGAAVSVLARRAGARLVVVDCGVAEPLPVPGVLDRRLGAGTASMLRGPCDDARAGDRGARDGHRARRRRSSTAPAAWRSARWASATPPQPPRSAARSRGRRRSRPAGAARVSTTRASRASATSWPRCARRLNRARQPHPIRRRRARGRGRVRARRARGPGARSGRPQHPGRDRRLPGLGRGARRRRARAGRCRRR